MDGSAVHRAAAVFAAAACIRRGGCAAVGAGHCRLGRGCLLDLLAHIFSYLRQRLTDLLAELFAVAVLDVGFGVASCRHARAYRGRRRNVYRAGVYNGNTFWDSEVCCLPFYLFNNPQAAKSFLKFRYDTLPEAKERAAALDCKGAFYPIATISGRECCDLWQHASLQLQASTGVAYGLWNYVHQTGDTEFLYTCGAEMLVEISRMLASRGDFDPVTGKYGYYCVMGPDEFQMMVHHNAYTNFMGQKTLRYTLETLAQMDEASLAKLNVTPEEMADWKHIL